jgi:hypothetical protein
VVTAALAPYGVKMSMNFPARTDHIHAFMPNGNQLRVASGVASAKGEMEKQAWEDRLNFAVPVDDENSLRFEVDLMGVTGPAAEEFRKNRRAELERLRGSANYWGEKILRGELSIEELAPELSTYEVFRIEDYVSQVGQGRIPDRSQDRISRVDAAVVLRRKLWERELKTLAEGGALTEWVIPQRFEDAELKTTFPTSVTA